MGLYESTVQHIITGYYMLLNADDKGKVNISRTKKRTKEKKEKRRKKREREGEKKGQG
jgi:hypothetical protein